MNMKKISVLVVDDSRFAREFISDLLSEDEHIRVAGHAENGADALAKVAELCPDIITMDIDMPVMDGLEAISRIMSLRPIPILVLTSRDDADTAYHAISKGALEVIPKPDVNMDCAWELNRKIRLLSQVKVISHIRRERQAESAPLFAARMKNRCSKVIAIAASTGGPKALAALLSAFPQNFPCPIVIAQHIASDFVSGLATWLDKILALKVGIGEAGKTLQPGTVYISPASAHMKIGQGRTIAFRPRQSSDIYYPSCNILLASAGEIYGSSAIGIVLTGMGNDGVQGLQTIKKAGGFTIAQDEQSSVIFGMPRAAIESGAVDSILSIPEMAAEIMQRVCEK